MNTKLSSWKTFAILSVGAMGVVGLVELRAFTSSGVVSEGASLRVTEGDAFAGGLAAFDGVGHPDDISITAWTDGAAPIVMAGAIDAFAGVAHPDDISDTEWTDGVAPFVMAGAIDAFGGVAHPDDIAVIEWTDGAAPFVMASATDMFAGMAHPDDISDIEWTDGAVPFVMAGAVDMFAGAAHPDDISDIEWTDGAAPFVMASAVDMFAGAAHPDDISDVMSHAYGLQIETASIAQRPVTASISASTAEERALAMDGLAAGAVIWAARRTTASAFNIADLRDLDGLAAGSLHAPRFMSETERRALAMDGLAAGAVIWAARRTTAPAFNIADLRDLDGLAAGSLRSPRIDTAPATASIRPHQSKDPAFGPFLPSAADTFAAP